MSYIHLSECVDAMQYMDKHTDAREGDTEHTHADVSKARELIGYEPSRDIREGVREFIEWYEQNRDWYEPLVVNS